jgi:murein DD-endopeptidase MepM/ murein hydrolase activator NlpD
MPIARTVAVVWRPGNAPESTDLLSGPSGILARRRFVIKSPHPQHVWHSGEPVLLRMSKVTVVGSGRQRRSVLLMITVVFALQTAIGLGVSSIATAAPEDEVSSLEPTQPLEVASGASNEIDTPQESPDTEPGSAKAQQLDPIARAPAADGLPSLGESSPRVETVKPAVVELMSIDASSSPAQESQVTEDPAGTPQPPPAPPPEQLPETSVPPVVGDETAADPSLSSAASPETLATESASESETVPVEPVETAAAEEPVEAASTPDPVESEPAQETAVLALVLGAPPIEIFPILGGGQFSSSYGAPRDGGARQHKGNDIFADKMTPVLAVASGVVVGAPSGPGERCCYVKVRHADGGVSVYLHLNNDTPGSDDGAGWGLAEGIAEGVAVDAGDVIGFVGDSGNAEGTPPHLHFEFRHDGEEAVDPYEMLSAAPILMSEDAPLLLAAEPDALPYTGIEVRWLAILAATMLSAGSLLLLTTRKPI